MTSKPSFDVPIGAAAKVQIIDTGFRLSGIPANFLLTPEMKGLEGLPPMGSWSFLVESSTGQKVLFDLGGPSDISQFPSSVADLIKEVGVKLEGTRTVADILTENGIGLAQISSVIWSHGHWDHIGDITAFPPETELVVGPGFTEEYYPGYPTKPDVELPERLFKGRNMREVDFSSDRSALKIGAFRALDFFGDGSFFLLDTPGHAIGHLAGLARTTSNPDTFIFMGGDICHHGAEIRPSAHLPIPDKVHFSQLGSVNPHLAACQDGALFRDLNVRRDRKPNEPFFDPVLAVDLHRTIQTIKEAQEAEAHNNVLFVFAHDMGISGVVDFFPSPANDWKHKGWKEMSQWNFLIDLTEAAVSGQS